MKKTVGLTFVCMLLTPPVLLGQHFLTMGAGLGANFYESGDIDRFRDTYNAVNADNLAHPLEGVGSGALALGGEIGYRHFRKLNAGIRVGWQTAYTRDRAQYGNGDSRNIEYRLQHFYFEGELGRSFSDYFINGLVAFFLHREIEVESFYSVPVGEPDERALNGTYLGDASFSADLGVAFGVYRAPFLVILRVSYPVYTGGGSSILRDSRPEKVAEGRDRFPRDYFEYITSANYPGARGTIDGLKVNLVAAIAFPF